MGAQRNTRNKSKTQAARSKHKVVRGCDSHRCLSVVRLKAFVSGLGLFCLVVPPRQVARLCATRSRFASRRTCAGTGLVGCARVPGEERSEGDADRVARASIAPQHTCSVAMLLDPCTYTRDPSLLTSPLEVTDFDQESRHGLASTSLALAAACRRRGSHTLAAARYLHPAHPRLCKLM